jgi:protocatechuate 3,4-dioxygenase beta subunit
MQVSIFDIKTKKYLIMIHKKEHRTILPLTEQATIPNSVSSLVFISGTVTDANGEPIPGATVLIEGSGYGHRY